MFYKYIYLKNYFLIVLLIRNRRICIKFLYKKESKFMTAIHQHLMFIGAYFAIIMGLDQFIQKNKHLEGYIYSISYISLGLAIFHVSSYSTGLFNNYYHLNLILVPFGFISAPMIILKYKWLINQTLITLSRTIVYLIPAILSVLIILYPLFDKTIVIKSEYLVSTPLFSEKYQGLPLYFKIIQLLYFLPKLYLIVFMFFKIPLFIQLWNSKKSDKSLLPKISSAFAANIMLSTVLAGIGDLFSTELITWGILYVNATFISLYLFSQRNPDYSKLIKSEIKKRQYEKSKIKDLDISAVLNDLGIMMENQKAFASEDITIGIVADELGITVHQLSEILNRNIRKNFNTFINYYRVEESKKLLVEDSDRTITSVAIAVGFNTSSAFSTIFSKNTGLSPKDYRKKYIKK